MPLPHSGTIIKSARGESFAVGKVLGTGGMGTVMEAKHEQSGRRVALKFLHDELLHHPTIPKRFAQEVQLATSLSTAHVARTFGVETMPDGTTFMIMEWLDGRDLCSVLRAEKKLPTARAAAIVSQACEALEEAHARGIVHRDLKPENLFISRAQDNTDWVKVLDFGISKVMDGKEPNGGSPSQPRPKLTRVGTTVGTPEYMAPEQLRGAADLDASADVYSLGVVLYEALTGQRPYVAKSYEELVRKICSGGAPTVNTLRPDVSATFADVIARAMHKDRKQRIPTARALREALGPHATSGRRAEWTVVMEPPPSIRSQPPSTPSHPNPLERASPPAQHIVASTSPSSPGGTVPAIPAAPAPAAAAPSTMTRGDHTIVDHESSGGSAKWIVLVVVVIALAGGAIAAVLATQ